VLWAPWALVVMTGISLWVQAHTGHRWRVQPDDLVVHLLGWSSALVLIGVLSAPLRRHTGAGVWAQRVALTLAVAMIASTAVAGLVGAHAGLHYVFGLLVLAAAAVVLARPESFEIFGLSAVALGLDALLIGGLAYLMLHPRVGKRLDPRPPRDRCRRGRARGGDGLAAAAPFAPFRSAAVSAARLDHALRAAIAEGLLPATATAPRTTSGRGRSCC
jgi:hypothetical protein